MDQLIAKTRIIPPKPRADLLSRERVRATMATLLDYRLILVIAPPGYGKTSALIDLVQGSDLVACWYAVGNVAQSPYRFFAHFVAAIQLRFPTFGEEANAALASYAAGQIDIEQIATIVANDLYTNVTEEFLFVVDDYHLVDDNFEIGLFVTRFVQQVDDNCHLLLSSRKLLSLPELPLLAARGYVGGLDFEDLAFQADELRTLALQNYKVTLDDAQAAQLITATEGWITGLLLSAQTKQWQIAGRMRHLRATGIDLYDYLAQQVLDQQPLPLRDFLLRTAYMEELNAELCAEVLKEEWLPAGGDWRSLIDALLQNNLYVTSVGEDDASVRYHHLFQEFLQQRLAQERPEEEREIMLQLLDALKRREQWEQAYHIAQRLDNSEILADLVEDVGLRLLQSGRLLLAEQWLEELTPAMLEMRPKLAMLRGYAFVLRGEVEHGLSLLERSASSLAEHSDPLALAQSLILQSVAHRFLGQYSAASKAADAGLETVAQYSDKDSIDVVATRALALRSKGLSISMMGHYAACILLYQDSLFEYQKLSDVQNAATVCMDMGIAYAHLGEHVKSMSLFQRALQAWEEQRNLVGQSNVLNSIGVHYHQHGQYTEALRALQRGMQCARRSGYFRLEAFTIASLADVFFDTGLEVAARDAYLRAYETAQRVDERFLILYLELAQANLAISAQEWGEVYRALDAAGQLVLDRSSVFEWALYRLAIGKMYLAQEKASAALEPLEDALTCFEESGQDLDAAKAKLWIAVVHYHLDDQDQVKQCLDDVLQHTLSAETYQALIAEARQMLPLLRKIMDKGEPSRMEARFLQEVEAFDQSLPLIRRELRRAAAELLPEFDFDPPLLRIRTLGRAEVLSGTHAISLSDWKTRAARDLFFCFLAHPDGLSKEHIGALFWPECSPDQLKSRFKNAIYRLRNALGFDPIVFDDTIYHFNHELDYEYDVEQFMHHIERARSAVEPCVQIEEYQTAVEIYGGDYLPDGEGGWIGPERERLRHLYLDALLCVAESQMENGQFDDSLRYCQQALQEDPCLEEAHRLAMRIYASTGNRAGVARQYALCQQALLNEIDVSPSSQTEELYANLMQ